jgi:hypothetical protein
MARRGRARFGEVWHGEDSFELVADSANITARHGWARRGVARFGRARTLLSWWRDANVKAW